MIPTLYEPFRHWSEKGSVYILFDLHFDDADCKFMSPDWITPQEQIAIINETVMKNDTFICLGDVGSPEYIKEIKARKKFSFLETMMQKVHIRITLMKSIQVRFL